MDGFVIMEFDFFISVDNISIISNSYYYSLFYSFKKIIIFLQMVQIKCIKMMNPVRSSHFPI